MPLPPDVEAKLAACSAEVRAMKIARSDIEKSIDEFISSDGEDGIPEELLDEPSVVREVNELRRVERRVARASASPVSMAVPAGGRR
jgi:hypothetical protein